MEQKLDELLKQLHKYLFADSEQVIIELRHYTLDRQLKEAELAFVSSKIFNSNESLLQFMRVNSQQNERILATVKKRIYELLIDFMKMRMHETSHYLQDIKNTCLLSFIGDPNSLVKDAALQVMTKIIEIYNKTEILPIIKPEELMLTLLDEIKLRKPSASVKGSIWCLVGLLHAKYDALVHDYLTESQDVCFQMLEEQIRNEKPEIKAIVGMLKGFQYSFEVGCSLDATQMETFFLMLKTIIRPIKDVNNRTVMKAGMKLLAQHGNMFTDQIMRHGRDLIQLALTLCVVENLEVRDTANELLGSVIQTISESLQNNQDQHIALFRSIMEQFDDILKANDYRNVQLLSAIRAVGIFSKAIKTILGDEKLWEYLERLTELSEKKLIKEFMEQQNPESDLQNFKYILKKQKQLIAYIESYSFMIRNLNAQPSEKFLQHFMKIGSIGVNNHRKLYNKYRFRFYESLAQLSMSLAHFKNSFAQWIKKFVRLSLTETLKIPDSVIFGGESPAESLADAVMFWNEYLSKDKVWAEAACIQVYDELMTTAFQDIEDLNLTYKVQRAVFAPIEQEQDPAENGENQNSVRYIANNTNDQQYLVRLANFLEAFIEKCHDQWLLKWIPKFTLLLVKKATQTPRISKLYSLLRCLLQICSKYRYFESVQCSSGHNSSAEEVSEQQNTFSMLLSFLKELSGKSEEFQDDLLVNTMKLLLHAPIAIFYQSDKQGEDGEQNLIANTDNLTLWKGIMIKALELSHINNSLAMTCIQMLEKWFNALPVSLTAELYADVLPKLSDFLSLDGQNNDNQKQKSSSTQSYFFQALILDDKEEKIERKDISNKALDLLGKIGGHAHSIINNKLTKQHEKENFIRWDTEKRLKFSLPLHNKKIDVYLDSCLPRIVDLAQNSNDKETRIAACELLHALVLFMIGKSATKPKARRGKAAEVESENMAAFAKLYAKLFPVIIRLATENEQISRQLFEPLCFQIVRWFSSSKIYEHPEVESLLDALIEGAQSRNNSTLREMCSNAVAEFTRFSLKQMQDTEIQENPANIKSLIRRIESNSNHPDPFKRLSSVLCFDKVFRVIQDYKPLMDRFCLEITRCVLGSLKMCHNSLEFSQEVIDTCADLLSEIKKQILLNKELLMTKNFNRSVHTSLFEFIDFLFSKFTAIETVYRHECIKLWESLVPVVQKHSFKEFVQSWYAPEEGKKSLFWSFTVINFTSKERRTEHDEGRKGRLLETAKQFDQLTSQLEFVHWLLKVAKFSFKDLQTKLQIDTSLLKRNIFLLFEHNLLPKFKKVTETQQVNKISPRLLICREDKEQLTKSKIRMLTQLFRLVQGLDIATFEAFFSTSQDEIDLELPMKDEFFRLALHIVLVPASHQLQLLVQDYNLEKALRKQCEVFINDRTNIEGAPPLIDYIFKEIKTDLPVIDLSTIAESDAINLQPRLLANLCLGFLKIAQFDKTVKAHLMKLSGESLAKVVDKWIDSSSPSEAESCRVLVSFMSRLKIPNEVLYSWLTEKATVFQKTSDLLLAYIAENWSKEKVETGEYLVAKIKENMNLLAVFLPILETVSQKTPGYQTVLIRRIPEYWESANFNSDCAENQVKVFCLIVSKCRWTLEQAQTDKYAAQFLDFVCQAIINFLQENKFSVYLKKKVLHLVGLLYNLDLPVRYKAERIIQRLSPHLRRLQDQYFPISSRELKLGSNEAENLEQILEGFLDLVELSKDVQVLKMFYRYLREHKPQFLSQRLKKTVNHVVLNFVNKEPTFSRFEHQVHSFMCEFFDTDRDASLDDNLRWAIADKVIQRILETCSLEYLHDLLVKYFGQFRSSLEKSFGIEWLDNYLLMREKTHVLLFLEVMVRRLDVEHLRGSLVHQIFTSSSQPNELTKFFISSADNVLLQKKEDTGVLVENPRIKNNPIKVELEELNAPIQVYRRFACAAYTLLSSVIQKTQTKQHIFVNYLFNARQAPGPESMWHKLVDISSEEVYKFTVHTNFNFIHLQTIESKLAFNSEEAKNMTDLKQHNLLNEYVTTSFMSVNEKFNSAMVFETQLDEHHIISEQKKVSEWINKSMKTQEDKTSAEKNDRETIELDEVNKHECMKNIKRCLNTMESLFSSEWFEERQDADNDLVLPMFMQEFLKEIRHPETHLNVKIFILKIVVNNSDLFRPYAKVWFAPICRFIVAKKTGGKGFHYFLRDLTTLLIAWSPQYTPKLGEDAENRQLCIQVVNVLIKQAADRSKMVFNCNIEILASLLSKWRQIICLEKETLINMLSLPESQEQSHLWKMTAIQVIALACALDISVLPKEDCQGDPELPGFSVNDNANSQHIEDKLLGSLLKMQDLRKKQLIFASSETLGKLMQRQPDLMHKALPLLLTNEVRERHDIFVNVVERVTREFPNLLKERKLFLKLLAFINVLTGSMRGAIFKAFDRYLSVCSQQDVVEISKSLQAVFMDILSDISDENQQNFLILVTKIVKCNRQSGLELLEKAAPRLKSLFVDNKNDFSRALFYDLMVYLYDNFQEFHLVAKSSIIRGLADSSLEVRQRLMQYWDNNQRLDADPFTRLEQLFSLLYDKDEEGIWLNNSVYLLLQVSRSSADFTRKMFDEPLAHCRFDPLVINPFNSVLNRSQPTTSSIGQFVFSASQAAFQQMKQQRTAHELSAVKEEAKESQDVEMEDANEMSSDSCHLQVAGKKSQDSQSVIFEPGLIRSTQAAPNQLFNMTKNLTSSLVASNFTQKDHATSDPPEASLSAAFYDLNSFQQSSQRGRANKGRPFSILKAPKHDMLEAIGEMEEPLHNKETDRSQFFKMNDVKYTPIQESQQGQTIRYCADGHMPGQLARKEQKLEDQRKQFIETHLQRQKMTTKLLRQYRIGELPDIQIDFKDMLLPLMALVIRDSTIATEVMVEIFTALYKQTMDIARRKSLGASVSNVLNQSVKFDYGAINCMHRVAIELLKVDGFQLPADVISRTGKHSMSFQTSLILLEETILHGSELNDLSGDDTKKVKTALKRVKISNGDQKHVNFGQITTQTKDYWFNLIQLYELLGNEDALKGIWCSMGDSQGLVMRKPVAQQILGAEETDSYVQTVNLIKEAQSMRSKGSIKEGLEVLEQALNSPDLASEFEDQIKQELQNQRLQSLADLLKWEQIASETVQQHSQKQLFEIPFQQTELMIRSQLRNDSYLTNLTREFRSWSADPVSKMYLEKRFNFEQALLFITAKDFDRARFFINKDSNELLLQWKDLTKLSQVAQHILVQKIQKIYEMKEFLITTQTLSIHGQDEIIPAVKQHVANWVQRSPSYSFDNLNVWDDILTSRLMYLDSYQLMFGDRFDVANTVPILYAQCAKGAFKMGMFDTCDRYLKTCIERRSAATNARENLRIVVPIIKLKTEQFKLQTLNKDLAQKFSNLQKISSVLTAKLDLANQCEAKSGDWQLEIKAYFLRQKLNQKALNLVLQDFESEEASLKTQLEPTLKLTFDTFDELLGAQKNCSFLQKTLLEVPQISQNKIRAKTLHHFSKVCSKILRKLESKDETDQTLRKGLKKIGQNSEQLACFAIRNGFEALNLGYFKTSDSIPRMLDIVSKATTKKVETEFIQFSKDTPVWVFLRWISQLVAVINRSESKVIYEKVVAIARKYPQALFYPFKVIESNLAQSPATETSQLFSKIQLYFQSRFENLNAWTTALDCLVHPEQRTKHWVQLILDLFSHKQLTEEQLKVQSKKLVKLMVEDVAVLEKPFIGNLLGEYNKEFATKMIALFKSNKMGELQGKRLQEVIEKLSDKMGQTKLSQGTEKLSVFSEYLHNVDNNDFYNPESYIEIPGQYEGAFTSEPIPGKNVKIASVRKTILILGSLHRPKRITVHGSNEKDYHLLIKGGEDLRLDQRIQQLFQIMNQIFREDPASLNRNLNLKTFNVVPITNRLGSLEWVDNTEPIKGIINREHKRTTGKDLHECKALTGVVNFLAKIPGNEKINNYAQQHFTLLSLDSQTVIDAFEANKQLVAWSLLRNGLENLCLTSSAFLTIKSHFIRSMATLSIASYLLGIGDRHLENFLVDTSDGEVLGIDFGVAFGSGVELVLPELIPFRLTQQIEGVIAPHPLEGVYKQTMIQALTALRKRKSLILDTCDIFVKEPLLDWLKEAKQKLHTQLDSAELATTECDELAFLPRQKIEVLNQKLHGVNPIKVLAKELRESKHHKREYYKQLLYAIQGPDDSRRVACLKAGKQFLEVEDQVECLIEQARDPDILGRTWVGWGAYL